MKIIRLSVASDLSRAYDGLKKVLVDINRNSIGKAKTGIKKVLKDLERARPHLKYKDRPVRRKW